MGNKIICIYHSRDLDGWMSAAIVKTIYPEAEFIGWDYGQELPEINPFDARVIMVDISFPVNNMRHLCVKNNLTWIDHHVSAIKDMESANLNPDGRRDVKKAACELTWEYFKDRPMPEIIRLLGRYDCLGHKGTDEERKVLIFQYAARASLRNIDECFKALFDVLDKHIEGWLNVGEGIYSYLCTEARQKYDKKFEIWLDGKLFACVNDWRMNPINFGINYHADGYDGFACFWYENGQFSYSLYNDNGEVDCSIIAKNRGGGGHKRASGFRSKEIIQ